jgi:hypothetical protein
MCSGRLTTSKTTSGAASTWISRSMLPNSVLVSMRSSMCNVWLHITLAEHPASRN